MEDQSFEVPAVDEKFALDYYESSNIDCEGLTEMSSSFGGNPA